LLMTHRGRFGVTWPALGAGPPTPIAKPNPPGAAPPPGLAAGTPAPCPPGATPTAGRAPAARAGAAPGPAPNNGLAESGLDSLGGSAPNIDSTDLRSSADFFSQSAGEAIFSAGRLEQIITCVLWIFAQIERLSGVGAPCVPVPLEDKVVRPHLVCASNWISSQSRSASSSFAPWKPGTRSVEMRSGTPSS